MIFFSYPRIAHSWASSYPHRIEHWWSCNGHGVPGVPAWSPDGSSIAFGEPRSCGTRIAILDVRSGEVQRVTSGPDDGYPSWGPDSRSILFSDGDNVHVLDLASKRRHIVARGVDAFGGTWSPDGRLVAYTHGFGGSPFDGGDGTTTVYVVSIRDGAKHRLVGHNVNGGTPAWSPDGREIALVGYGGLWTVHADGTDPLRILKRSFSTPGSASWAPGGRTIAFVSDGEIDAINTDGHRLRRVTSCSCNEQADGVTWSSRGKMLAFSTKQGIDVVRADGTHRRSLVRY